MFNNETKNNTKIIPIVFAVIAVIAIALISIYTLNQRGTKAEIEQKITELKEEKISLSARKNEEFKENGFSEEYYRIQENLTTVQKELSRLELNSDTSFVFVPIIMFGVVTFGIIFIIFTNVITGMRRTHDTFDLVHDVIRTNLKTHQLNSTKIASVKCPSCKASMPEDATVCEYCGTHVTRIPK